MRLTGKGIWGEPKDVDEAKRVLPSEIQRARKVINIVSVQNLYKVGDRRHEDESRCP